MSETEKQLKRIQDKLQQLIKQQSVLQKENELLKEELARSKQLVVQHHENIDRLKEQIEILKLGNAGMNESEKKQFEKRINGYLKEIDRCIAMLSS